MSRRDTEWKATACNLCYANCGVLVETDGRRIKRVRGDKNHPASKGYTCNKALQLDYYQNGRDRLTNPLRRRADGSYEAISWDLAISEIAERMMAVRDTYGGDKIMRYGGGGQGNHLGGTHFLSVRNVLGMRYASNALAQEKTGFAWMMNRMFGRPLHGELEHAQCLLIIGKNPWQSNSFQRARIVLRDVSRDPERTLIVIDPRRTESAELADIHLAVKPGRDAWVIAAMIAHVIQEGLVPTVWVEQNTLGFERVRTLFQNIDVDRYAEFAGLSPADVKAAARAYGESESSTYYEDLGIQMAPHSTLVSYLNLLLSAVTGNFGKTGTLMPLTSLIGAFLNGATGGTVGDDLIEQGGAVSPVLGERIVGGLVPCNIIPEEILTDHPNRYRAMFIESGNPCHSLTDSESWRRAMRALDCSVVIDVAMTETARQADYVLPAASQYEKAESTFFNFEYPNNIHHLRPPLFEPLQGTLPEAEIHARLFEALKPMDFDLLEPLRVAAAEGLAAYGHALMTFMGQHADLVPYLSYITYRTLGPTLPNRTADASTLLGLAWGFAMRYPEHVRRAGIEGEGPSLGLNLFESLLENPSGAVFSVSDRAEAFEELPMPGNKIQLDVGEMRDEIASLSMLKDLIARDTDFPFLLAAGERRSHTANTVIRNPAWMKSKDVAALAIHPEDASAIGLADGGRVKIVTEAGAAVVTAMYEKAMHHGTVSLPNGLGLLYPNEDGIDERVGVPPNELTSIGLRDKFVGTPLHKHVPARLEAVDRI